LAQQDPELQAKLANDQYAQGFNEQVEQIHALACSEFLKGAAETEILLNEVRAQQQQQV